MTSKKKALWYQIENKYYYSMACYGQNTYLCSDGIMGIFNNRLLLKEELPVSRNYKTFCYDCEKNCFWAASLENPSMLYCLSEQMEEIKCINLQEKYNELEIIDHLFYDSFTKQICFSIHNEIFTMDPSGNVKKIAQIKKDIDKIYGIGIYIDNVIYLAECNNEKYLGIHSISQEKLVEEQVFSLDLKILSVLVLLKLTDPLSIKLRILAVHEEKETYLIDYELGEIFINQYSNIDLTDRNKTEDTSDIQMQQYNGNWNFESCTNQRNKPNNYHSNCNHYRQTENSYSNNCSCSDCNCKNKNNSVCCHQSCNDIIESIALTETSIAHILNAEGEKLQKAIACSSNVSELLKINESIVKTIIHSTHLEQMLYSKLECVINNDCCICHCSCKPYGCEYGDTE